VLVLIGTLTVLNAGVNAVAKLFDDTAQKQEYEDKLEGLVLFDPVPFEGIENIDDLTLREAAVWGCVYSIQETQGGFDGYNTDPDTEQLLIPLGGRGRLPRKACRPQLPHDPQDLRDGGYDHRVRRHHPVL
jgi:hypothetical protein